LEIFQTYESTHEIIIGGDLNEDLTKQKNSRRLLKLWQFLIDTNLTTDHKGAIFINSDCVEVSEIDYFLYSSVRKYHTERLLDIEDSVSDHYPIEIRIQCNIKSTGN
jgi:endonuclease/exonuclease/phosphatase family metal-dependent hydrolase